MSPLARSLLALACAALLHASSAVNDERVRAALPNWNADWPCARLDMGIQKDKYVQKVKVPIKVVRQNLIEIENAAKPDQALVGQHMIVCDLLGAAKNVTLRPKSPNTHSPISYTCHPLGACNDGVIVITDQYVIPKLL